MATKKVVKKPKQLTMFFETKEKCSKACELLGLSARKVTDIDKSHNGNYSKYTGHYALKSAETDQQSRRVRIRAKLIVDENVYNSLNEEQITSLDFLEITNVGWIA